MPPTETPKAPVQPGDTNPFPIDPDRPYILILPGVAIAALRGALDAFGRNAGADQGRPFWDLRAQVGTQVMQSERTEAEASGLIAGRESQRAAAKVGEIKKNAVEAVSKVTGSRLKK